MDAAQLKVTLRWKEGCDLDLMVFYRLHQPGTDKDGAPLGDAQAPRAGWILSTNYSVGMGGMLTEPPYIGLTEDAGGTRRGDYQEELRFFRLDLLEEFHVYVVNYTAARQETSSFAQHRFSDENTTVEIVTTDARLLGGGDRRLRFPLYAYPVDYSEPRVVASIRARTSAGDWRLMWSESRSPGLGETRSRSPRS
ncbi:MAG: hypothetical protein ABIO70_33390, partial [Pseudomonadota bacterium]